MTMMVLLMVPLLLLIYMLTGHLRGRPGPLGSPCSRSRR